MGEIKVKKQICKVMLLAYFSPVNEITKILRKGGGMHEFYAKDSQRDTTCTVYTVSQ